MDCGRAGLWNTRGSRSWGNLCPWGRGDKVYSRPRINGAVPSSVWLSLQASWHRGQSRRRGNHTWCQAGFALLLPDDHHARWWGDSTGTRMGLLWADAQVDWSGSGECACTSWQFPPRPRCNQGSDYRQDQNDSPQFTMQPHRSCIHSGGVTGDCRHRGWARFVDCIWRDLC